jgi:hypothetical protein
MFNNTADTPVFEYVVAKDLPPTIYLREPVNGSYYNTSNVLFLFKPVDDFSQELSCKVDDFEEANVTNDTWFSKEYVLGEGHHSISISCKDRFGNVGTKHVNFTVDLHSPIISNVSYQLIRPGVIRFSLTVSDNLQLSKFREEVWINDTLSKFFELPLSGTMYPVSFEENLIQYSNNIVRVRFIAYDKAGNNYTSLNLSFAVSSPSAGGTVSVNAPPMIQVINPVKEVYGKTFTIKFKVLDESSNVSCSLFLDSSKIPLGDSLPTGSVLVRNITLSYGEHMYYIICSDEQGLEGFSGVYSVRLKPKVERDLFKFTLGAYSYMIADKEGSPIVSSIFLIGLILLLIGIFKRSYDLVVVGLGSVTFLANFVYFVIIGDLFGSMVMLTFFILTVLIWSWFKRKYLL